MNRNPARRLILWLISVVLVVLLVAGYYIYRGNLARGGQISRLWNWLRDSDSHPEWAVEAGERCGEAPFILPTDGFIGFLWDDSFRIGHRHQGIDIFGGSDAGITPIIVAYPGYLTRLPDWKSTVIIRIPEDPLKPGRQIWTYYTHMADKDGESLIVPKFPPGTFEEYVQAGTLLGYQGNYSGNPANPVGVHLHFSIVLDDGNGGFRNELEISNTLDPSPYLGLPLNAKVNTDRVVVCDAPQAGEIRQSE